MGHSFTPDLQLFVERLTARSALSREEQDAILSLPTERAVVKARHDLVQVHEKTSHCCFIAAGLVARTGLTRKGARQITAFHIPGDMADLHSAVRPIGVGGLTALSDTVILRVPHPAVRALAARFPGIAEALWRDCMLDTAILMEWVVNVGARDARTRLAHIFCEMALRYGRDLEALTRYTFPITQEQLGEAAGLTGVHVNRSLKGLREAGLVTLQAGEVTIHDFQLLARTGEFDPQYLVADTGADRPTRLLATA